MAFLSQLQLEDMGFKQLGRDVLVSDRASIYQPELISIGDHSRIDDFCVLSGEIAIGRHVHIAVFCNIAAGRSSISFHDFSGLAYGCHIIAQSDDYSGATMTNPTVPAQYKRETSEPIEIGRHAILGTSSIVLPGVNIATGTSCGPMTLFNRPTDAWTIYLGSPARAVNKRSTDLLSLEAELLAKQQEDFSSRESGAVRHPE